MKARALWKISFALFGVYCVQSLSVKDSFRVVCIPCAQKMYKVLESQSSFDYEEHLDCALKSYFLRNLSLLM